MAYTQLEYDTLVKAIAQGALVVKYGDKEVTYRSLSDMLKLKGIIEAELTPAAVKPSRRFAQHSKGLTE